MRRGSERVQRLGGSMGRLIGGVGLNWQDWVGLRMWMWVEAAGRC